MEHYNSEDDKSSLKFDQRNEKKPPTEISLAEKNAKRHTVVISSCFSALALLVGIIGGIIIGSSMAKTEIDQNFTPEMIKYNTCYNLIKKNWYYGTTDTDIKQVMTELFSTGQSSVDPYTFLTPDEDSQNLGVANTGYGYQIIYCPQGILMEKVFKDGPMYKAGGRDGDIVTALTIDGVERPLTNQTFAAIQKILQDSRIANKTSFTILRAGETLHLTDLVPGNYTQDTAWKIDDMSQDGILTIRIDSFLGNPNLSVAEELITSETDFSTLVLDLRNNGGGYINQMANLAALFTPKNHYILQTKNREGEVVGYALQTSNPQYSDIKIKILQNGMSASASESLALSLQQNNQAEIYGFQSYGKGIAQDLVTLNDGSVLRYTTLKVFAPDGITSIHGVGITPDFNSAEAETYNFTEYPYNYTQYILTNENYSRYLDTLASFLDYLGYPLSEEPTTTNIMANINLFQRAENYEVTNIYTDEVTKELMYEIYLKETRQDREELSWVTGLGAEV